MNLSEEVDLEDYVARPDKINNAEIASICQVGWVGFCLRWGVGQQTINNAEIASICQVGAPCGRTAAGISSGICFMMVVGRAS